MMSCADGAAVPPQQCSSHNFKYHVFQSFRCILKDFFVRGLLFGTEFAYIIREGEADAEERR